MICIIFNVVFDPKDHAFYEEKPCSRGLRRRFSTKAALTKSEKFLKGCGKTSFKKFSRDKRVNNCKGDKL